MLRRKWIWILSAPVILVVAVALLDVFIDKPLRGFIERQLNANLTGYGARVRAVDFRPWNFSLEVLDTTLFQQKHPDPPVAHFQRLNFNVSWRRLLVGRIVADLEIDQPTLHINLVQLEEEWKDDVDLQDRGWQQALLSIYPLKVNELMIHRGAITYIDDNPEKPLKLTNATIVAHDIRNVRSEKGKYPSPFRAEARLFDTGTMSVQGRADFLAEPHVGVLADGRVERVPLDRLDPVVSDYHIQMTSGLLSATGRLEYAPWAMAAHLKEVLIDGVKADYVVAPGTEAEREAMQRAAVEAAEDVSNDPGMLLRMDLLRIRNGEFGFVNNTASPDYRAFVTDANVELTNLSNQQEQGEAKVDASGAFMGSGATKVTGSFRPDVDGPDFDLNIRIRDTNMVSMNDIFKAYAKLDVTRGQFSYYSELSIKNGHMTGYVKPLFRDVNVYDPEQDKDKNIFRKLYEGVAEEVAELLENEKRDEVATVTQISGPVEDPRMRTWPMVVNLLRNAFVDAILPGFEEQVLGKDGKRKRDRERAKRERDERRAKDGEDERKKEEKKG